MHYAVNFLLKLSRKIIFGITLIALCCLACSLFFSFSASEEKITPPSPKELKELAVLKDQSIASPKIRVQVKVDYSQGKKAAWYPKGEAPVLAKLVEQGKLPPVTERVGSEPLVLQGPDGIGKFGGSAYRLNDFDGSRFCPVTLVRWSPQGYPIVPNLAKSFKVSKNKRIFTFKLRKGVRWSDGHPFTSEDIRYWWEKEQCDKFLRRGGVSQIYVHHGKPMKVTFPDAYTVVFSFDHPNAIFLEQLATYVGDYFARSPKHYLEQFHPVTGNKKLIKQLMQQHNLLNEKAVYYFVKRRVEMPTLEPWMLRTEKMTPPEIYVRNPYYFAVDPAGNQLPYVDRVVVNKKSDDMLIISASQGEVTMQARKIMCTNYTMLMNQREQYGYKLLHWTNGDGADWGVSFNANRKMTDKESEQKSKLLENRKFRQALSMAIDRQAIIDALLGGMVKPFAVGPGKNSPFFNPDIKQKYAKYDTVAANKLLDECGLTARDADGYRKFPGGVPLLFDINYCSYTGEGPGEFIVEYWRKAGINARLRSQDRSIFYVEKSAALHDMTVWGGYGAIAPYLDPRYYLPFSGESNFAPLAARWYYLDGIFDKGSTLRKFKPADSDKLYQNQVLYEKMKIAKTFDEQKNYFDQIIANAEEEVWHFSIYASLPQLAIVKNGFMNVPVKGIYSWSFLSPSNLGIETWYFDKPDNNPQVQADVTRELLNVSPLKPLLGDNSVIEIKGKDIKKSPRSIIGSIIKWCIVIAVIMLLILIAVRNPYVLKRLTMMVPTLFIISVISFVVIEIPPGDAISSKIMVLQEAGDAVDPQVIEDIKVLFRTERPAWKRYTWWMGLDWFLTFDRKDEGLLQGNMGRSMLDLKPVNEKVGDRLLFTFLISLGTILFTWAIALPIGIYSAVKQYSFFDYLFTIFGFIGMCIPGFLLALLLMFASEALFGLNVSGLFSPEYAAQNGWPWGKIVDLMKHIWLPILIQGIAGTAGMIRVMRANLLDELKKPYVITARAKGVRPLKLLFKYPVRLALNPFVSGIGGIFPRLISGGAIVAIVMSLPTIGPMQLDAVMQQDMYLAGSMLMLLSLLSVLGTLFSDILLSMLDPRIRLQGGSK